MCMGIPMQVVSAGERLAQCLGRGELREVNIALVGAVAPGDWVLVFIDSAIEIIDAGRAAEVNATLDLLAAALTDQFGPAGADPGFALPSAMSADALAALTGGAAKKAA
ncbi:HypC/HybG/HupF family hydrogenase formation chaperone [Derxia lacustris]|uniref:HypC/HybG/HupF family hydrogenase formation chaperone n=1 Tax=Derxia lacustris TaxID=764842 RepID=UPI000A16FBE8|nr:HypC/HybG/HupF family hydrogenase formation chaperone [Derxia lacustris]